MAINPVIYKSIFRFVPDIKIGEIVTVKCSKGTSRDTMEEVAQDIGREGSKVRIYQF